MLFCTILGFAVQTFSHVARAVKLNLLACVSASADLRLQKLGLQLQLGNAAMQIEVHLVKCQKKKQLSVLPSARSLYIIAKDLLRDSM